MKGLMRPERVVVQPPGFDDQPSFGERLELVLVEALVAKASVKTLDVRVLGWLPRLNVMQANASFARPAEHRHRRQFGAVVHHDRFGISAYACDRIEYASNAMARKRRIHFDC